MHKCTSQYTVYLSMHITNRLHLLLDSDIAGYTITEGGREEGEIFQ